MVFLRGENEETIMEDDQGITAAKRGNIKTWLGKMFTEGRNFSHIDASSKGLESQNSQNQWENFVLEIHNYYEQLLSLNMDEDICEEENEILQADSLEEDVLDPTDSTMVSKYQRYFLQHVAMILFFFFNPERN